MAKHQFLKSEETEIDLVMANSICIDGPNQTSHHPQMRHLHALFYLENCNTPGSIRESNHPSPQHLGFLKGKINIKRNTSNKGLSWTLPML
jgi:hypothetical protein